jgi:hypothetical protein
MIAGAAREARAGRSKAREISRKIARLHRAPRAAYEELSGAEDVTLWVLGGIALLGGGYLAWKAMQPSPAAPGSPPGPPGAPGAPGTSLPPAIPPTTNPAGITWPSTALPWAPPSTPANLPVGFSVTDDVSSIDPMFVAMAQSSLQIIGRASVLNQTILKYTGPVDGQVSVALTNSLISLQTTLAAAYAGAGANYPGSHPHTDGTLDAKTLAVLITYALLDAGVSGSIGAPTYTSDPIIIQEVYTALGNMVNTPSMAALVPGVTFPLTPAAVTAFQAAVGKGLPTTGLVNGQIDWATWGVAVGIAG